MQETPSLRFDQTLKKRFISLVDFDTFEILKIGIAFRVTPQQSIELLVACLLRRMALVRRLPPDFMINCQNYEEYHGENGCYYGKYEKWVLLPDEIGWIGVFP